MNNNESELNVELSTIETKIKQISRLKASKTIEIELLDKELNKLLKEHREMLDKMSEKQLINI